MPQNAHASELATPATARTKPRFKRGRWVACELRATPTDAGCYALFNAGKIVYIGSAVNLRKRLRNHGLCQRWQRQRTRFGQVGELSLKVCIDRRRFEHATRELRLISRLKPPHNAKHTHATR